MLCTILLSLPQVLTFTSTIARRQRAVQGSWEPQK